MLRELSRVGRVAFLAAFGLSAAVLVMEHLLHVHGTPLFLVSAGGILALAYCVGLATERIGALTGPQVGGILNATFGNVAELIIAFFALKAGMLEVVKASITGSIIGNLLLVFGASLVVGGLRHGTQRFSQREAALDGKLLLLAVISLFVPAVFAATDHSSDTGAGRLAESTFVAAVLIVLYFLALLYRFRNPDKVLGGKHPEEHAGPAWPARVAVGVLLASAVLLALLSETLVASIEPFITAFHLTPFFVGVILIPTIGNLAEHMVAVQLAARNHMDFALAVTTGSSLQIALFVAPVLVLLGRMLGQPMDLVFAPLEIAAVSVTAFLAAFIIEDGESNWLEGALLLGVYLILGVSFFYLQ
ncbi:MAG: calcium/proton exchanger [Planctomycetota bacterium]|nr:MAG: calcium/proton exchanger [Planctomycetota bacterium]